MLNGWETIELKFYEIFGRQILLQNLNNEIRKLSLIYLKVPLLLIALLGSVQFFQINLSGLADLLNLIFRFISFLATITLSIGMLLHYFMICHIMSRIYRTVHDQILARISSTKRPKFSLDNKTIRKWQTMLFILSEQMRNIGDFLSPANAVHILVSVINFTVSVYTILGWFNGSQGNISEGNTERKTGLVINTTQLHGMVWFSLVTNLGTMLLEVYFAEKIYKEVCFLNI